MRKNNITPDMMKFIIEYKQILGRYTSANNSEPDAIQLYNEFNKDLDGNINFFTLLLNDGNPNINPTWLFCYNYFYPAWMVNRRKNKLNKI